MVLGCPGGPGAGICSGPPDPYLVSVLNSIGYRAHLKLVKAVDFYSNLSNSKLMTQAGGIAGWAFDYPSPGGELTTLLAHSSFQPASDNNPNFAEFSNPGIDRDINHANELQQNGSFQDAAKLWTEIDREATRQSPYIVIDNFRSLSLVSPRVGNYTYNLVWSVPFLDQLWVK